MESFGILIPVVKTCASGSAVEHLLAKEGVAGSIPVSRSHEKKNDTKSVSFQTVDKAPSCEGAFLVS